MSGRYLLRCDPKNQFATHKSSNNHARAAAWSVWVCSQASPHPQKGIPCTGAMSFLSSNANLPSLQKSGESVEPVNHPAVLGIRSKPFSSASFLFWSFWSFVDASSCFKKAIRIDWFRTFTLPPPFGTQVSSSFACG